MTHITFVRHGETDWNALGKIQGQTDIPLNERGINQAFECGQELKKKSWDYLVTSPLKRAKQTAEIINQELGLDLVEMDQFKEKYFGEAEGMKKEDRSKKFPDRIYPNQEPARDLHDRIFGGLAVIQERYQQKNVLVVAHGGVINAILSVLSNQKAGSGITNLTNGSITTIHFKNGEWDIKQMNQIQHLTVYSNKGTFTTDVF